MGMKKIFCRTFVIMFITAMMVFAPAHVLDVCASESLDETGVSLIDGDDCETGLEADTDAEPAQPLTFDEIEADEDTGASLSSTESSGTCGTNATWTLSDGVLTISGTGEMDDYTSSSLPGWYSSRTSITSIVVESGITKIGKLAFYNCTKATSVSIPNTVTSLGNMVFAECSSLTSVTLPSGITEIPYGTFANCTSLTSLTATGVTTYGSYAFQNVGFTTFTIGAKVTDIDTLAFYNTESITAFKVASGNTTYTASNGVLFTDGGKTLFAYPAGNTSTSYTISDTVTKVGDYAFIYSGNLQQINFGSGVTAIGDSAFRGSGLTSVAISNNITEVSNFTFYNCTSLKTVTFGTGLKETSYEMFEKCTALTTINFGSTLNSLYARTFAYCGALTSVTLPSTITSIGNACFGECTSLKSFSCSGLTSVPYQAFFGDTSLTEVTLGTGLTIIYRCAFYGCSSLLEVVLPSTITFVHSDAFETCTNLVQTGTSLTAYGVNGLRSADTVTVTGTRNYTNAYKVLDLVNEERVANGLSELVMNESLLETAMQRAAETSVLFEHTRPDGGSCFTANSLMSGENIAYGYGSADDVMEGWMNSSGHKANILGSSYTTIGIGCFIINGTYYWVQCFGTGSDTSSCASPSNKTVSQTITVATGTFEEATTTSGIIWGDLEEYEYALTLKLAASKVDIGASTTATVYIKNPGNNALTKVTGSFTWKSSNTAAATVSAGTVKGIKFGSANISATTQKGGFTGSATVNVYDADYTGILKYANDGKWYYVVKGVKTSYNGIVKNTSGNGKWYYVKNGVFTSYNGIVKNSSGNGKWYYVKNGVFTSYNGIVKNSSGNGKWYYVKNGVFTSYNGIVKNTSGNGKWYYVKNGVFTSYNGIVKNTSGNGKWYYVKKGVFTSYNGIVKNTSGNGKWYYVKNGVFTSTTGLVKNTSGNGKWYYVKNGVFTTYTGKAKVAGSSSSKYYYVVKGLLSK